MSQGRGSAVAAVMMLFLVMMVLHCEVVQAATYTVGGGGGWTFNTNGWPKGKRFRAGDTLVFNYNPRVHNVVAVSKGGYDNCSTPRGSRTFQSGKDQIKLARGQNFFICSFAGHCQSGMKIAINAV